MALSSHPAHIPEVAVVTVSFGSGNVLGGFLDSVPRSSADPVVVVVADNATDDFFVAQLSRAASAEYLALKENQGYGAGMNAGIASLPEGIKWVLVSNPDVVLEAGAIDALVRAGREDDRIGSVGPAILTDGAIYPSARAVPSLRTGVGHALFANVWPGNPWTRAYRRDSSGEAVRRDAGWLSGACVLVRKSAFDAIGGFDDGFFMYFEDVDLGYRLGKAGYRNVYEPAAVVTHAGAHATTTESARMITAHHESALRFLSRKYSGRALWPVRTALRVGLTARSAVLRRNPGHH